MTRCAIYVRFSSDQQKESSLRDQERECREYAEKHDWDVVEVYSDAAISGGSDRRPGFQNMLADAARNKFDIVLAEAWDRLSRNLGDSAITFDTLQFHGVRIFTMDFGEMSKMHIAMMGHTAEQFVSNLREKTKRGQKGRILDGMTAGGLAYGYTAGEPGERNIVADEAEVVRQIFRDYAAGLSPRAIAQRLNRDGIPGPRGRMWKDTTIRGQRQRGTGILNNQAYIGKLLYGRTRYRTNPSTRKRVAQPQKEDAWVAIDAPHLRIVDDELWQAVKDRQDAVATVMPRDEEGNALNRLHRKQYPLSGIVRCGVCGGPMAITARGRYGCSNYRTARTCTNKKTIPRTDVENRVFAGLKKYLLDADLVAEFLAEYQAELARLRKHQLSAERQKSKRLAEINRKVERLVDAIVDGTNTASTKERLLALEAEKADLERVAGERQDQVIPLPNIDKVYRERVHALMDAITAPELRQEAISLLQSMIERVVVTPLPDGFGIDVHGEIGAILNIVDQKSKSPGTVVSGRSLSVVAGVGFEPTTFRL